MNQVSTTIDPARDSASGAWATFAAAASDEAFCGAWLALQCALIPGVRAGLLLLRDERDGSFVPAAVWPDPRKDLSYLTTVAERALAQRRGAVLGTETADAELTGPDSVHVAYPVDSDTEPAGVVALHLAARPQAELQGVLRQLVWGSGWLELLFRRRQAERQTRVLERAAIGLDLVQAAQEQESLDEAALVLVNELATQMRAGRVSLGMERAGTLELRAMSRTAWFDRRSQLVEAIENAMEEAIYQESSAAYPAHPDSKAKVVAAQRDLAARSGAAAVLSVPLVSRGKPVGAITLERDEGPPFDAAAVLMCEVACELLGPVMAFRLEGERWFAGRSVETLRDWRDRLIGPRHPLVKLGAGAAVLALLFLSIATGDFRVTARTVIEGRMQRAAVAPFDGYIERAEARAGDVVSKGEVLAVLDDREIRLERARWDSEKEQAARKYRESLAKRDAPSSRIHAAQQNQAAAQLALTEEKLLRTQIVAPLDSVVVSGDLSQMIGAPVERGKVLFELAPLGAYRVILQVDDRDIAHIAVGQHGELALAGITGETLPFTVKSVTSVSTPQDGRNFFRVEAEIEDAGGRLRPGMEGVAKVSVEERRLVWIWTRNFLGWLRLALWNWLP